MKAGIIGIIVVVLVVVAGAFYFFTTNKPPEGFENAQMNGNDFVSQPNKTEVSDSLAIDSNLAIGSDSSTQAEYGSYQEYSQIAFDSEKDKRRVLFFYASWCPECKVSDPEFKANIAKIPEDVVILRVNYNDDATDADEKALASKYGITYQHTFVQVDKDGKVITTWHGEGIDKLLTQIK